MTTVSEQLVLFWSALSLVNYTSSAVVAAAAASAVVAAAASAVVTLVVSAVVAAVDWERSEVGGPPCALGRQPS